MELATYFTREEFVSWENITNVFFVIQTQEDEKEIPLLACSAMFFFLQFSKLCRFTAYSFFFACLYFHLRCKGAILSSTTLKVSVTPLQSKHVLPNGSSLSYPLIPRM